MEKVIKVIFILLKSSTYVTLMLLSLFVLLKSRCCTIDFVTGIEISAVIKSLNSEIYSIGSIFSIVPIFNSVGND